MSYPKFGNEFGDWLTRGKFTLLDKSVVDHEVVETGDETLFSGIFQPMKATVVALKPEGQRTWKWDSLITSKALELDDVILYKSVKYRVFAKQDYKDITGYNVYDIAEAFHTL
jgi:hypothetical protein